MNDSAKFNNEDLKQSLFNKGQKMPVLENLLWETSSTASSDLPILNTYKEELVNPDNLPLMGAKPKENGEGMSVFYKASQGYEVLCENFYTVHDETDFRLFYTSKNNITEEFSTPKAMNLLFNGILESCAMKYDTTIQGQCKGYFSQMITSCLNRGVLASIPYLPKIEVLKDTKNTAYFHYKNCTVKVTPNGKEYYNRAHDKPIFKKSILPHNLIPTSNHGNFGEFVKIVSGNSKQRFRAICSALGYLVHQYKEDGKSKAVIFIDDNVSDTPNGRSGKSLLVDGVAKFCEYVFIDGKKKTMFTDPFLFSEVREFHKMIWFDDVTKSFDFESLFASITGDMNINIKGGKRFTIKKEDSPKIAITSNYAIMGSSGSHNDRRHEVSICQFFNAENKVPDYFGELFWDNWNEKKWSEFLEFMMSCVQLYLKEGLCLDENTEGATKRKVIQYVGSQDFYDFITENLEDYLGAGEFDFNNFLVRFHEEYYAGNPAKPKPKSVHLYLSRYCESVQISTVKRRSNGKQLITLTK